jgi:hypothetical protein
MTKRAALFNSKLPDIQNSLTCRRAFFPAAFQK